MPLADLFVCGLVSPCFGYLPQEHPKEVPAHVPNRGDLSGFLCTNYFRNGCRSLFQKVDGNTRITEELFRIGNRLVGDALSNRKHARFDAPAGGGHHIQEVLLV